MLVFVLHYLDPPPHPRAYPDEFGQHLLDAFKTHVDAGPGRRDLRFKPQLNMGIPELIQFQLLPLGDDLSDLGRIITWASCFARIPEEWLGEVSQHT